MQNILKLAFIIACLCGKPYAAVGQFLYQKGYIIKPSGDTIRGEIRDQPNDVLSQSIFFRERGTGKTIAYTPSDLKGFFIAPDDYFEAFTIPVWTVGFDKMVDKSTQTKFIRKLVQGQLSMYVYDAVNNSDVYFIKKNDAPVKPLLMTVKQFIVGEKTDDISYKTIDTIPDKRYVLAGDYIFGKEYLKTLYSAFSDWKDFKPHEIPLSSNAIKREVVQYNEHVKSPIVTKVLSKGRLNFNVSAYYGFVYDYEKDLLSYNDYRIRPINLEPTSSANHFQIFVGIGNRSFTKGVTFELGYISQKRNASGIQPGELQNIFYSYEDNSNLFLGRVSWTIFPSFRFSPYAFFGFGAGSSTVKQTAKKTNLRFGTVTEIPISDKITSITQENFGIGVNLLITRNHAIKVEYSPAVFKLGELNLSPALKIGYQVSLF